MKIRSLQATNDGIIVPEARDGGVHRRVIYFGADITNEPLEVRDFAASIGFSSRELPAGSPPTLFDYSSAIQTTIEAMAQGRGYDSSSSLISYLTSSSPQWAGEAVAFVAWRDRVWEYAYTQFALVQSGQRQQPSVAALVAELPVMTWPT